MKIMILLVLLSSFLFSQEQTYIREYTYTASERDSKISSRTYALKYIKALLLEEITSLTSANTHLIEKDENGNVSRSFVNQIDSFTVGKVKCTILEEKWNGTEFWLKAKLKADPEEISRLVENPPNLKTPLIKDTQVKKIPQVVQQTYIQNNIQRVDPNIVLTAKIAQVFVALGNLKIYILQYESMHGKWPSSFEDMHLKSEQMNDGQSIESIKLIENGGVKVFLSSNVGKDLILVQEPRSNMGGLSMKWTCSTNVSPRAFDLIMGIECKQQSYKKLLAL